MVDIEQAVLAYLLAVPASVTIDGTPRPGLAAVAGTRIYPLNPPPGYKPADGQPTLLLSVAGTQMTIPDLVIAAMIQFQAVAKTEATARALGRALADALHQEVFNAVVAANPSTTAALYDVRMGQSGILLPRENATDWPVMLSVATFMLAAETE